MKPPRSKDPEVAALIAAAQAKCAGCRIQWRLYPTLGSKYSHRGGVVCLAPVERKALRDIAARARK